MMECALGTMGLLAMAGTTLIVCGVAVILAVFPQRLERRKLRDRAAYLRAQLLHQLEILPQSLEIRNRPLAMDYQHLIDEFSQLALQAGILEMEEWKTALRTQSTLLVARNKPSFSKREARVAQRMVDDSAAVLQSYVAESRENAWWRYVSPGRRTRPTSIIPSMAKSL